jgi:tetratricopeptide (TPR) repeat protein
VAAALAANTASKALEAGSPSAALALNPANRDARLALAVQHIEGQNSPGDAMQAAAMLERGIVLSPADARLYSLLGIASARMGDAARAEALFDTALAIAPGEIQALTYKFNRAAAARDMALAAAYLEVIARRWPQLWENTQPALPALMADEKGFAAVDARFGRDRKLQMMLLGSLIYGEGTQDFAARLILGWISDGDEAMNSAANQLTAKLLSMNDQSGALALFRNSRTGEAKSDTGPVHNAGFEREPSGNAFDWSVERQPGVSIERTNRRGTGVEPDRGEWLMQIRFLDSPIRLKNLRQTTSIAPGRYELVVDYESDALRMPRPVALALTCAGAREPLAMAVFEEGSRGLSEAKAAFIVPAEGCLLQELGLRNEDATESWRNRYSGSLLLHSVKVERLAQ